MTCYSCHRGQPVPAEIWFPNAPKPQHRFIASRTIWQEAADTVRKFFPDARFAEYFLGSEPIAVQSTTRRAERHAARRSRPSASTR